MLKAIMTIQKRPFHSKTGFELHQSLFYMNYSSSPAEKLLEVFHSKQFHEIKLLTVINSNSGKKRKKKNRLLLKLNTLQLRFSMKSDNKLNMKAKI